MTARKLVNLDMKVSKMAQMLQSLQTDFSCFYWVTLQSECRQIFKHAHKTDVLVVVVAEVEWF